MRSTKRLRVIEFTCISPTKNDYRRQIENALFKILPNTIFAKCFLEHYAQDYCHWFDLQSKIVEFIPLNIMESVFVKLMVMFQFKLPSMMRLKDTSWTLPDNWAQFRSTHSSEATEFVTFHDCYIEPSQACILFLNLLPYQNMSCPSNWGKPGEKELDVYVRYPLASCLDKLLCDLTPHKMPLLVNLPSRLCNRLKRLQVLFPCFAMVTSICQQMSQSLDSQSLTVVLSSCLLRNGRRAWWIKTSWFVFQDLAAALMEIGNDVA